MARGNGRRAAVREQSGTSGANAHRSERPAYTLTVKDLPEEERPRERLLAHGANTLSNSELIAIILRTGTRDVPVMDLARKLLARYGGLGGLARVGATELVGFSGLGMAKAVELRADLADFAAEHLVEIDQAILAVGAAGR